MPNSLSKGFYGVYGSSYWKRKSVKAAGRIHSEPEAETVGPGERGDAVQTLFAADGEDVSGVDQGRVLNFVRQKLARA